MTILDGRGGPKAPAFKESAIRKAFPTAVEKFEGAFPLADIVEAIVACGYDEDDAMVELTKRLMDIPEVDPISPPTTVQSLDSSAAASEVESANEVISLDDDEYSVSSDSGVSSKPYEEKLPAVGTRMSRMTISNTKQQQQEEVRKRPGRAVKKSNIGTKGQQTLLFAAQSSTIKSSASFSTTKVTKGALESKATTSATQQKVYATVTVEIPPRRRTLTMALPTVDTTSDDIEMSDGTLEPLATPPHVRQQKSNMLGSNEENGSNNGPGSSTMSDPISKGMAKRNFKMDSMQDGDEDSDLQDFIGSSKKRTRAVLKVEPTKKQKVATVRKRAPAQKIERPKDTYYKIDPDFMDEACNVVVFGEDETKGNENAEESLPVRILEDFTVYNLEAVNAEGECKVAYLDNCGDEGFELRVSGRVLAARADDGDGLGETEAPEEDDEDEDDNKSDDGGSSMAQFINLSTLFHWEMEMVDSGHSVIWVRTQFAYYKLGAPSATYTPFFKELFKKVRLANLLMVNIAEKNDLTLDDFYGSLDTVDSKAGSSSGSADGPSKSSKFGWDIPLTVEDFEINIAYIHDEVESWMEESAEKVGDTFVAPIMTELEKLRKKAPERKGNSARHGEFNLGEATDARSTVRGVKLSKTKKEEENEACVTPLIATLAGSLFNRELQVADHGNAASVEVHAAERNKPLVDKAYTLKVEWVGNAVGKNGKRTYYESALVDGELLTVGDCVYVRNEEPEPWMAKIMYFFEIDKEKCYHVRYFSKGSETILMETAGWRELFLLDNCGDADLDTVISKCQINLLGQGADAPDDDAHFYRYWYDTKVCAFEDVKQHETMTKESLALCEPFEPCMSCARQQEIGLETTPAKAIEHEGERVMAFKYMGHEYHQHDFVYLVNCKLNAGNVMIPLANSEITEKNPYNIGQIVQIMPNPSNSEGKPTLKIRLMERYDSFLSQNPVINCRGNRIQKPVFKDCRRLVLTDTVQKFVVDAVEGTCRVMFTIEDHRSKALAAYKDQANTYYYKDYLPTTNAPKSKLASIFSKGSERALPTKEQLVELTEDENDDIQRTEDCKICHEKWDHHEVKLESFLGDVKKLRALDIFSGCGGLSTGLKAAGIVDTRYAIEFFTSAARTYSHNFPNAKVYNDDANALLRRAIMQHNGQTVPPRNDFSGAPLPAMPAPGDVDLIYCGPPCQGFSGMNRYQHGNELKNSLIATSLSYVDFYQPEYFLLENVRGMMQYKLGGVRGSNGKSTGGIVMGVVKFIIRCLTAMGYQCRFGLLQAGQHGLPQSRRRFFIWGAKIGSSLPGFPQPQTCFPKIGSLTINVPVPGVKPFTYQGRRLHQAPDPAVTVRDAISDLPGMDYVNPHKAYPEDAEQARERQREEQRAAEYEKWINKRKRKQRARLVASGQDFTESDLDGYYTSAGEESDQDDEEDDDGMDERIRPKPYFMMVGGEAGLCSQGIGFTPDKAAPQYWTRPQSEFQRRMRNKHGNHVKNHIVRKFNDENLERICRVAMTPEADHRSLPDKLKPWCLSSPDSAAARHNNWKGLFGRLDYEDHFQTAVTDMQPMGKQGKVIHPNQYRVLSVRECARVQGFPDSFTFLSYLNEIKCMYKQIGNAVPPPLANALGLQLRDALMANEDKPKDRKGKGRARF